MSLTVQTVYKLLSSILNLSLKVQALILSLIHLHLSSLSNPKTDPLFATRVLPHILMLLKLMISVNALLHRENRAIFRLTPRCIVH